MVNQSIGLSCPQHFDLIGSSPMTMHRGKDRSKKGSLDAPIVDLVRGFNSRHVPLHCVRV